MTGPALTAMDLGLLRQMLDRPDVPQPQRTVGPTLPGNLPLPEGQPPERREARAMGYLADALPILGAVRGVARGHARAQAGHPVLGALDATLSMIPTAGLLASTLERGVPAAASAFVPAALDRTLPEMTPPSLAAQSVRQQLEEMTRSARPGLSRPSPVRSPLEARALAVARDRAALQWSFSPDVRASARGLLPDLAPVLPE